MKDPQEKIAFQKVYAKAFVLLMAILFFGGAALLVINNVLAHYRWGWKFENSPWWADAIFGLGFMAVLASFFVLPLALKQWNRYKALTATKSSIEWLEVLDSFTFLKLLPGDQGPVENYYYIVTAAGNWRLPPDKLELLGQLNPGACFKAVVLTGKNIREIIDLEELDVTKALVPEITTDRVKAKLASELRVTGYKDGVYTLNKLQLVKEIRYYLVVNDKVLQVDKNIFRQTPIYSVYQSIPA